ncbi:hypothetical protein Cpir12675_004524 [Ceratocystis pirilliformis]|uniref:PD-(D/E)XK nuclease-like domain-containing protein n=1 Tax=Ceratocystis pirilliformis TaxID=259994 RepID=A0ABR3YVS8_9PEZI
MAHNSKLAPEGTPHTNQPISFAGLVSLRSRPSSSMSMRSTASSALSQRPAIASLAVRNTPSRQASQLSFSKTPSYLSKRANPVSNISVVSSQSPADTITTISNCIDPVPEVHGHEASTPSVDENRQEPEIFPRVTSQREERINRHASNETPASESDDEDLPDPRMFIDIPGLRLPALEDLKRRHAEQNERRQAKAAEKGKIATTRPASDAGSTVNQDVSPTPSLQALTPQTSASAATEQGVNEEVPPVQPAVMHNDSDETENETKANGKPVEAQNGEVEISSNTSAKLIQKTNNITCNAPKILSPVSEIDDKTCEMDWEIVLVTTSSFKAIRPRVSQSEPGFVHVLDRIRGILEGDEPFLPAHKRHDLETLDDFQFQPESAYGSHVGRKNYSDMIVPALTAEMEKIIDIVKKSNESQLDVFPCYELHRSVLQLAFEGDAALQDLDNAQICYQFLVDDTDVVVEQSGPVSRAQLVKRQSDQDFLRGYGIGLNIKDEDELRSGIKQFLKKCIVPSITPSMYRRMRMTPMGIFMGSASLQDPVQHMRSRLFVWAASWFKRFDLLRAKTEVPPLPVLPLISAEGDMWRLFFACRDDFEQVVIVGPVVIGSTAMVQETYRLVAVLQVLGEWLHREFRVWIENLVSCPSK